MVNTRDGFVWTPAGGYSKGLPTIGVVSPSSYDASPPADDIYDAIVIGAGYAGLTAIRDLATQGKKTLLLEGRDRLGGRTWNAVIDGFNYEMGGTWIHWHMPHIYREVSLYGLQDDWIVTQIPGSKEDYCTLTSGSVQQNITHEQEAEQFGRVWSLFCNMDGDFQRQSWKYPFGTGQSPELMAQWDQLSCQDRLEQIQDQLTEEDTSMLIALLQQMGGASLDRMGLLDALRWWTLGAHQPTGLNDIALHTRLGSGNSTLHCRMFEHALSTGNLSYRFSTAVTHIDESDGIVTVTTRDGAVYKTKAVISTIPLNVLSTIRFSPPLEEEKVEAVRDGSVNKCNKIHVDLKGPDYLSWSSFGAPGLGMVCALGDQVTPAGNSHLVGFGPDPWATNGIYLTDIDALKKSVLHLLPEEKRDDAVIERIVSHDWNKDEFARGTWCYLPPKYTTKYLAALQRPHGNVLFASGDWSHGWRGWIDGALQIGMEAAHQVIQGQRKQQEAPPSDVKLDASEHVVANGAPVIGKVNGVGHAVTNGTSQKECTINGAH